EAAEIGGKQRIAVEVGGLIVTAAGGKLFDLAEDPGIGRSPTADHDGVATGFTQHALRVRWSADIAVSDDRDAHGLLDCANHVPVRRSLVALPACARMHRNG